MSLQVWDVKGEDAARVSVIQDAGHQSGIRAAALSGDDTLLLTVAAEGVKVPDWYSSGFHSLISGLQTQGVGREHASCLSVWPALKRHQS